MLYSLILTDPELSYDNYSEDFDIGIFSSRKEAVETAQYYLKNVKGFCDYPCTYQIVERNVLDCNDDSTPEQVWLVQGWNENDKLDEIDLVESSCFPSEKRAAIELKNMQQLYQRTEWNIDRLIVGQLSWCDGFERIT